MHIMNIETSSFESIGHIVALIDGNSTAALAAYAELLGTKPTYAEWEKARMDWRTGYASQREEVTANTLDKAWSRFASDLNTSFGLIKPKSESVASEKKAKAEAGKEEKTLKVLESFGLTKEAPLADLKQAAVKALESGDANALKVVTGVMSDKAKEQARQEEMERKAKEKAQAPNAVLKRITDKIKGYDAAELLALEALLDRYLPSDIMEMAKEEKAA